MTTDEQSVWTKERERYPIELAVSLSTRENLSSCQGSFQTYNLSLKGAWIQGEASQELRLGDLLYFTLTHPTDLSIQISGTGSVRWLGEDPDKIQLSFGLRFEDISTSSLQCIQTLIDKFIPEIPMSA